MARINSKKKGNASELEVVHILNEFFHTEDFARVPMSGGWASNRKGLMSQKEKDAFVGDIICPDWFKYSIEVKNVRSVNLWKIFDTSKTPFDEQVEKEILQSGNKNMLLVFRTLKREWLCIDYTLVALPEAYPHIHLADGRIIMNFKKWLEMRKEEKETRQREFEMYSALATGETK